MATAAAPQLAVTAPRHSNEKTSSEMNQSASIVTQLSVEDTEGSEDAASVTVRESRTLLHIYIDHECGHRAITPIISPSQERRFGPKPAEQKARRAARKAARVLRSSMPISPADHTVSPTSPDINPNSLDTYYLHTPYLSFHLPASILYTGTDRHVPSKPVAIIHTACFWRSYRIQLGSALSAPGVIDPRGVVSGRHNGGSKRVLREDEKNGDGKALKGYRVRGWRLWGETGKAYVHRIREKRRTGEVFDDPDVDCEDDKEGRAGKVVADEVVRLTWTSPLSRHTRCYAFWFRGMEFQWKGTGTVREQRKCGWMLRWCHLKLVARVPVDVGEKEEGCWREFCLGKYTSSIAAEKSGTLEVFDDAVVRLVEENMPGLLAGERPNGGRTDNCQDCESKTERLKGGVLYQVIVATVLCMMRAEKEKRHTLIDLIIGAGENAGNGGG